MACGETFYSHVIAVAEIQYTGITRKGFKCRCGRIRILGFDRQILYIQIKS